MQFPFRDLTNQYISLSYQDVVQRYAQGTASYFLDGLGNVIAFVPTSSLGQQLVTADQLVFINGSSSWASASLSSSYAQYADTASLTIYTQQVTSASYASHSHTSDTASMALVGRIAYYAYVAEVAETASIALLTTTASHAEIADFSYHSVTSDYALSASTANHALIADFALGSSIITGSLTNEEFDLLFCSQSGGPVPIFQDADHSIKYNPALGRLTTDHIVTNTITASYIYGSISHAIQADTASLALFSEFANSSSYALESTLSDTASLAAYANYAGSASYSISSSHALVADVALNTPPSAFLPMEYKFSTSTISSDPGAGKFKFDNAAPASVTSIYISDITNGGLDVTRIISRLQVGQDLYIQDKDDSTIAFIYDVSSAPVDNGTWFTLPVTYITSSSGLPVNNAVCLFLLLSQATASMAISASHAVTADTASYLSGFNFVNTGSWISILNTDTPIIQIETGSYDAAFFDYVALSGSNTRAGMVFGSWVNGLINYTEVSNVNVGDTSKVTMSLALAGNVVQLIANVTDTTPWKIKALARYL